MSEDTTAPRSGSGADLSRRMDRLEAKHDELAGDVTSLKGTVQRVEQNQNHAAELNKLRFDSLDTSTTAIMAKLDAATTRFEQIASGEIQLPATRRGEAIVADFTHWREIVESRLEIIDQQAAQLRLLGRLAALACGSGFLSLIVAIGALLAQTK